MQDLGDHELTRPGAPHGRDVVTTVASDPPIRGWLIRVNVDAHLSLSPCLLKVARVLFRTLLATTPSTSSDR
jgi:hypothetical protein